MSFGWSAGDLALGIRLAVKVSQALRTASGSQAQYQNTISFLKGVQNTVSGIETLHQTNPNLPLSPEIKEQAGNLKKAVLNFKDKIASYDSSLGENPTTNKAKQYWKRIRILLEHVEELKVQVGQSQVLVDSLINLEALNILIELSHTPTVTPQDLQDSTRDVSQHFPTIVASLDTLQSGLLQGQASLLQQIQQVIDQTTSSQASQSDLLAGQKLLEARATAAEQWRRQLRVSVQDVHGKIEEQSKQCLEELKRLREAQNVLIARQRAAERAAGRVCQVKYAVWSAVTVVGSAVGHCIEGCCAGGGGGGGGGGGSHSTRSSYRTYGYSGYIDEETPILRDGGNFHTLPVEVSRPAFPSSGSSYGLGPSMSVPAGSTIG